MWRHSISYTKIQELVSVSMTPKTHLCDTLEPSKGTMTQRAYGSKVSDTKTEIKYFLLEGKAKINTDSNGDTKNNN